MSRINTLSYNGVNLAVPRPAMVAPLGANFQIQDVINNVQAAQNQANQANTRRYKQGLRVLGSGMDQARGYLGQGAGFIQQALADTDNLGRQELADIAQRQFEQHAAMQQSAINRGLANTTITDSLGLGINREADRSRQNVLDQTARVRSGIRMQQAQQANTQASNERSGAGEISSFIAARNDNAPSLRDYAGLVEAAEANRAKQTRNTARVTNWPATDAFGRPTGGGVQQPSSSGGGGALGSSSAIGGSGGGYFSNSGGGGTSGGSGLISSLLGGFLGRPGGGSAPSTGMQVGDMPNGGVAFMGNGGYVVPGGSSNTQWTPPPAAANASDEQIGTVPQDAYRQGFHVPMYLVSGMAPESAKRVVWQEYQRWLSTRR